jgi:hypothetical protein
MYLRRKYTGGPHRYSSECESSPPAPEQLQAGLISNSREPNRRGIEKYVIRRDIHPSADPHSSRAERQRRSMPMSAESLPFAHSIRSLRDFERLVVSRAFRQPPPPVQIFAGCSLPLVRSFVRSGAARLDVVMDTVEKCSNICSTERRQ